jgi:hypothetical protein
MNYCLAPYSGAVIDFWSTANNITSDTIHAIVEVHKEERLNILPTLIKPKPFNEITSLNKIKTFSYKYGTNIEELYKNLKQNNNMDELSKIFAKINKTGYINFAEPFFDNYYMLLTDSGFFPVPITVKSMEDKHVVSVSYNSLEDLKKDYMSTIVNTDYYTVKV